MRTSIISKILLGLAAAIAILTLITFFTGCYTKKQAVRKFCIANTNVKDSTAIIYKDSIRWKTSIKDSIRIHPGTEQYFNLDNLCDSLGRLRNIQIKTRSGGNSVSIQSNGNTLTVKADCDSTVERYRQQNDSLVHLIDASTNVNHSAEKTIVTPLPPWYTIVPRWAWIWLLITTGYCAWRAFIFLKPFIIAFL